ncbi:hypothetical protein PHLCEN_2v12958 [Hermanssonia centrifuga]|uniref:Uncharacterized protein n=1 Tax=Hermanssonia centrifuga TaxID=98765 RepID=A0A2R6NGK5_9APHY|nr:hypothetical protein PHLCEN_2v12958 [Hermanssonia centrifuga]
MPALENISPVSSTISTLTPILISRALLNLRQASYTDTETYTQNAFEPRASVAGFRFPGSGLGDMGAGFENDTSEEAIQEDGNVEQSQEVDTSAHYVSATDDVSGVQVVARDAAV